MTHGWARYVLLIPCALIACKLFAGIADTSHNLAISGTGTIRAVSETGICIFCHIPHNSRPGRAQWNHNISNSYYTPYASSTVVSSPGQPNGASILCLSCHDGTIALGDVTSEEFPISMLGGVTTLPPGPSVLGTDLSDDHPISFRYTSGLASQQGDLVDPMLLIGPVKLDSGGWMQCTSCHDPHDDRNGKFLTMDNRGGELCTFCHRYIDHWDQSAHSQSTATWNGIEPNPWPDSDLSTVADNACGNCHRTHNAGGRERILNHAVEEDNCLPCHNGNVASINLEATFRKVSIHPINDAAGVHDPAEDSNIDTRHVECEDCHNPHAAGSTLNDMPSAIVGVRGVTLAGVEVESSSHEYEICFRCHGDSLNKPAARTPRQIEQLNVRDEFVLTNPSYHPVAGVGKNLDVPSLLSPYSVNSTIDCIDCHDNDNSSALGGAGPKGPHGSNYAPILIMRYETLDDTPESPSSYALCYKCHDRNSILNDESFTSHRLHIVDQRTSCNVCHDPHGVSAIQGNALNNSKLINFDISIVLPNSAGELRYESTGRFSGSCFLMCHGSDHAPLSY